MTEQNAPQPSQRDIDFQETVASLQQDDMRAISLRALKMSPLADERILPYLEELLTDTTPCVIALPYRFGEVRWLAAYALAEEREALGIKEPVRLPGVVRPLDTNELATLAQEANVHGRSGIEGILEEFAQLRELGKLPRYDLELNSEEDDDNEDDNDEA